MRDNEIRKKTMPDIVLSCPSPPPPQKNDIPDPRLIQWAAYFWYEELSTICEKKRKRERGQKLEAKSSSHTFHSKYLIRSTSQSAIKFKFWGTIELLMGVTFKVVIFEVSTRCRPKNCDVENMKRSFFEEVPWLPLERARISSIL